MIPLRGEYARLSAEMDGHRFDWEDDDDMPQPIRTIFNIVWIITVRPLVFAYFWLKYPEYKKS